MLEWSNYDHTDYDMRIASTEEKAKEIFKEFLKDKSVADLMEQGEIAHNEETDVYAYDCDNVMNLYIVKKEIE
jgi:hypothetical protein